MYPWLSHRMSAHSTSSHATYWKRVKWRKASSSSLFLSKKRGRERESENKKKLCAAPLSLSAPSLAFASSLEALFSWCYHFQFASSFDADFWMLSLFSCSILFFVLSHVGIYSNQNFKISIYIYMQWVRVLCLCVWRQHTQVAIAR